MIICPKCGAQVSEHNIYCVYCGAKIQITDVYSNQVSEHTNQKTNQVTVNIILTIIITIITILGIYCAYRYKNDNEQAQLLYEKAYSGLYEIDDTYVSENTTMLIGEAMDYSLSIFVSEDTKISIKNLQQIGGEFVLLGEIENDIHSADASAVTAARKKFKKISLDSVIKTERYKSIKKYFDIIDKAKKALGISANYKIGTQYYWSRGKQDIIAVGAYNDSEWIGYVLMDANTYNVIETMKFSFNDFDEAAGDIGEYYEVYKSNLYKYK